MTKFRVFLLSFLLFETEEENKVICVSAIGNNKPFHTVMVDVIPDLHLTEAKPMLSLLHLRRGRHKPS